MSQFFALELGSSSVKLAALDLVGIKSFTISALGKVANDAGSLDLTNVNVQEKLAGSVRKLIAEFGVREKRVVISIPESQVYSRVIEMPYMTEAELSSAINWQAEQFVPIPLADVEIDFAVVKEPIAKSNDQKMLVYMVAAPKKLLKEMVDFMIKIGLEPIAVESEMVSISRAISMLNLNGPTLILNLGALSSVIGIIEGASLYFSYVFNIGGVALTRNLASNLNLPLAQAEEYKKIYGLNKNELEGKVRQSLIIVIDQIIAEMRKAMEYFATSNNSRIDRIVLTGGGAYLPQLTPYLSEELGNVEVIIADLMSVGKATKNLKISNETAGYTTVIGLAGRTI